MVFFENKISLFHDRLKNLPGDKKKQIALICTAVFSLLLVLSVFFSLGASGRDRLPQEPKRANIMIPIPPQEIFLPDEPDFLPPVMLEREQRTVWTEQETSEYWQDPLRQGEEQWRIMIESAINEFLERIP